MAKLKAKRWLIFLSLLAAISCGLTNFALSGESSIDEKVGILSKHLAQKDFVAAKKDAVDLLEVIRVTQGSDEDKASARFSTALILAMIYRQNDELYSARALYQYSFENWKRSEREGTKLVDEPFAQELLAVGKAFNDKKPFKYGLTEFENSLTVMEVAVGPAELRLLPILQGLSKALDKNQSVDASELIKRRIVFLYENQPQPDRKNIWGAIFDLGLFLDTRGRYKEAVQEFKKALAVLPDGYGVNSPQASSNYRVLGGVQGAVDDAVEQERSLLQSVTIAEQFYSKSDVSVAEPLMWLARMYVGQGRAAEARSLIARAVALYRSAGAERHADLGIALIDLANADISDSRPKDAIANFEAAIKLFEQSKGPGYFYIGTAKSGLAPLYADSGKLDVAERLALEGLAIAEKGGENLSTTGALNVLSGIYQKERRYDDALKIENRNLAIIIKAFGEDHLRSASEYARIAWLYFLKGSLPESFSWLEESLDSYIDNPNNYESGSLEPFAGAVRLGASDLRNPLAAYTKIAFRFMGRNAARREMLLERSFIAAQWSTFSDTDRSVSQMAARHAANSAELEDLVRDRDDLVSRWRRLEEQLIETISSAAQQDSANLRHELDLVDEQVKEIDLKIQKVSPSFAELTNRRPVSLYEIRTLLRADEALVFFQETPDYGSWSKETYVWAITKTAVQFERLHIDQDGISKAVATLRCGLDRSLQTQARQRSQCENAVGQGYGRSRMLPFDLDVSFDLYQALFGKVEKTIADKELLIIPSASLLPLPPQVLVTQRAKRALPGLSGYRHAQWFIRDHAISILPSVSSLKALRQTARESEAPKPFIGFGNPILTGGWPWTRASAAAKKRCGSFAVSLARIRYAVGDNPLFTTLFRSGNVDPDKIRQLPPLPDSADELCAIAREVNGSDSDVYLGERATEETLKRLSKQRLLENYRVVDFASHALVAGMEGDTANIAEPGIVLTPPKSSDEGGIAGNDGLLTVSEIVKLRMNADFVILSACNTAAGLNEGSAQLSGLAQAFFYAGTREVLVSNWSISSSAAVQLTTAMLSRARAQAGENRAQALRRSMIFLLDQGSAAAAHPSYWAPFSLVGDGEL
ncbi:CHAT domain-containing tetratricopeptide repeat protein [Rhizobium ruizarguesonis]|uniref:CHAT domain-containing tetratricopeptide repeat protein n=1 Tax=Rhizobium ruizarguesonis TaxID=2081791 RepID=UPI0009498518|nr:CHAT domain-containing tetratricopeptide repeat protein [Rhizobium ruizarguesonis]UED34219.1 CHAT domain-containing protein [Rhizobium ruizarguesonis]